MNTLEQGYDIVAIGGDTAGPMVAIKAKEHDRGLHVSLASKANVKHNGTISTSMDRLNNAIVPGHATAEQHIRGITVANDDIVNRTAVYVYASHSFETPRQLDHWGVRFEEDETGGYTVKKAHHVGAYVLSIPEGYDIKRVLYRQLGRARIPIANHLICTRLLTDAEGAMNGVLGLDRRSDDFHVIRAKAVILCYSVTDRLGLPSSGYLMGTYEDPTNAGDGYAMAYYADAELANLECFQINLLIRNYNSPACAYVTGPLGDYIANARGERFIGCDYWSGQIMWEFHQKLEGSNGPMFLELDHLAEETIWTIEDIFRGNEYPSHGQFHIGRGTDYRQQMVEMRISEIGFCSGHSASGVWVNEKAETSMEGLYAAGDMAVMPHNYMFGAFTYGWFAEHNTAEYVVRRAFNTIDRVQVEREYMWIETPLLRKHGLPVTQVEYKLRRLVNDYLQPSKVTRKVELDLQHIQAIAEGLERTKVDNPRELIHVLEVSTIRDCAEMVACASLFRTESRQGLYHHRVDYPRCSDEAWFYHTHLKKGEQGHVASFRKSAEPYLFAIDEGEQQAYQRLWSRSNTV